MIDNARNMVTERAQKDTKIDAHKITGRDNKSSEKWKVSFTDENKRSFTNEFGGSPGSNK